MVSCHTGDGGSRGDLPESRAQMNIAEVIGGHADDQIALIDRDDRVDFGTLRGRVAAMQIDLQARGVGIDTTVALAAGNDVAFVVSTLAVLGPGGIVMLHNPGCPTSELARKLAVASPSMLLVGHAGRLHLDDPAVGTPTVDLIAMASSAAAAHVSGEAPSAPVIVDRPDDAPAFYLATSGVSGAAKVAVLSHHNLSWIHEALQRIDPPLTPDTVTLGILPFTHIFGLNVVLLASLEAGAAIVLQQHFDAEESLRLVREHGVTTLTGAPPMWQRWLDADAPNDSLATVDFAASGAAALPVELFEGVKNRFGVEIAQGYGLTETSPVSNVNLPDLKPDGSKLALPSRRMGSVGQMLNGIAVRVTDATTEKPLPLDQSGMIWLKGANIFHGYLDLPEKTAEVKQEGWFCTGDIGRMDADGFLYIE
ncbi:MAG: AMP-binding protein, partial [Ilumatobacter sp.]|nr:AMP-binding protein [Ilumatobacter sp.]